MWPYPKALLAKQDMPLLQLSWPRALTNMIKKIQLKAYVIFLFLSWKFLQQHCHYCMLVWYYNLTDVIAFLDVCTFGVLHWSFHHWPEWWYDLCIVSWNCCLSHHHLGVCPSLLWPMTWVVTTEYKSIVQFSYHATQCFLYYWTIFFSRWQRNSFRQHVCWETEWHAWTGLGWSNS